LSANRLNAGKDGRVIANFASTGCYLYRTAGSACATDYANDEVTAISALAASSSKSGGGYRGAAHRTASAAAGKCAAVSAVATDLHTVSQQVCRNSPGSARDCDVSAKTADSRSPAVSASAAGDSRA